MVPCGVRPRQGAQRVGPGVRRPSRSLYEAAGTLLTALVPAPQEITRTGWYCALARRTHGGIVPATGRALRGRTTAMSRRSALAVAAVTGMAATWVVVAPAAQAAPPSLCGSTLTTDTT